MSLTSRTRRPAPTVLSLKLEQLSPDTTWRLRAEGNVEDLATSLAQYGQLFPIDVRPFADDRFQIVCGFRRVLALRTILKRENVVARVHEKLADSDALVLAFADMTNHRPVKRGELEALKERLEREGRAVPAVRAALERMLGAKTPEPLPEEPREPTASVRDAVVRLAAVNEDLARLAVHFPALSPAEREALFEQLAYPRQLLAYLKGTP